MTERWRSRSDQAKEIVDEALALANRARSAGLDVVAYILELAATEARKESDDTSGKQD